MRLNRSLGDLLVGGDGCAAGPEACGGVAVRVGHLAGGEVMSEHGGEVVAANPAGLAVGGEGWEKGGAQVALVERAGAGVAVGVAADTVAGEQGKPHILQESEGGRAGPEGKVGVCDRGAGEGSALVQVVFRVDEE